MISEFLQEINNNHNRTGDRRSKRYKLLETLLRKDQRQILDITQRDNNQRDNTQREEDEISLKAQRADSIPDLMDSFRQTSLQETISVYDSDERSSNFGDDSQVQRSRIPLAKSRLSLSGKGVTKGPQAKPGRFARYNFPTF